MPNTSHVSSYVTFKAPSEAGSRKWLNQWTKNSSMTYSRTLPPRVSHHDLPGPAAVHGPAWHEAADNRQGNKGRHICFPSISFVTGFELFLHTRFLLTLIMFAWGNCHFYEEAQSVYPAHEELFWEAKGDPSILRNSMLMCAWALGSLVGWTKFRHNSLILFIKRHASENQTC